AKSRPLWLHLLMKLNMWQLLHAVVRFKLVFLYSIGWKSCLKCDLQVVTEKLSFLLIEMDSAWLVPAEDISFLLIEYIPAESYRCCWTALYLDAADVLPNQEIFDGLQAIGYRPDDPWSFLFKKGKFAPQWKFLIHYLNHCISPKGGSFTQFGSQLASALGMVSNVSGRHKFLMYPRFVQLALNITPTDTTEYDVPSFTSKVFANIRQYEGPTMPLLAAMLPQVAQMNPLEGPPIAPQADELMPDPAHAPNVEELIPSPVLEPVVHYYL
nr:hypothetical protein [Tanacetum cinerariifolium]